MKEFTTAELSEIIERHGKWLRGEDGGERADLSDARLNSADLSGADLRRAIIIDAYLPGADLSDARLNCADLRRSILSDADLRDADLRGADLSYADLSGAGLSYARLNGADLSYSDLSYARLNSADLSGADLRGADLRGAYLSGADLSGVLSLWGTTGNMYEVKSIQCDTWAVTYTAARMQIGCRLHTLYEWWSFTDKQIEAMDSNALGWWRTWKPILKSIIDASPADPSAGR